jgi:hypothetical protein
MRDSQLSVELMNRGSDMAARMCGLCAEFCDRCAEDCERMADGDETMKRCAETCRRCAASCRRMAAQAQSGNSILSRSSRPTARSATNGHPIRDIEAGSPRDTGT